MKRKILALAAAGALAVGLAGCAPALENGSTSEKEGGSLNGYLYERTITLDDGREVLCLFWDSDSYDGGMSCDWENAKQR